MGSNKFFFQWVIKIKWPTRIIWIWNTNSSITILIHFRWCPTIAVIILFHFLPFLPRWFTPVFYPRPNPDRKTITEQKNNFLFRSRIKSSVNLPKYLQKNKKGFKFELKNSKRQKTKWIKMDRTKTGRTKNGPEK